MIVSEPISKFFSLAPGEALTVVADAVSTAIVVRLGDGAGGASQGATAISASTTTIFGPFNVATRFTVVPTAGSLTVTQAIATGAQIVDALTGVAVDSSGNQTVNSLTLGSSPAFVFSNGLGFYTLTTAITVNVTTTTAASGSIGITSHATGIGKLFISDGSKWQYAVVA